MRIGLNPNKDQRLEATGYFHQVIVPVHIPNQEGYFADSFRLLQYCIGSLLKTSHNKTFFTIVNNGSCKEVEEYINELKNNNAIHEVIHTTSIGKLNSILKGLSGQKFDWVTITDADVLFLNNWQKATYGIFSAFPKAGAVCPSPSSRVLKHFTYNVILSHFFNPKLAFTDVVNGNAMKSFAHSIGNPDFYNEAHLEKYLTISNENTKAVIGAGHFVATYKSAIFNGSLPQFSEYSLGGDSEELILDKPVVDNGYWRLSTEDNFAYHMGNSQEPWMKEMFDAIAVETEAFLPLPITTTKTSGLMNNCKKFFFRKIIVKPLVWSWFLKYKGLSKEASKKY